MIHCSDSFDRVYVVMKIRGKRHMRGRLIGWVAAALAPMAVAVAVPANAQGIRTIDPNAEAQADAAPPPSGPLEPGERGTAVDPAPPYRADSPPEDTSRARSEAPDRYRAPADATGNTAAPADAPPASTLGAPTATYRRDDLIGAAEGVFGRGAAGLGGIIERILKDQGEPNAYISGREASGAFVVGLRYGSGTLKHKVEGDRPVYWTGPSIGFDVGGDATKVFTLVYNLYDSQDLYKRYPQIEGRAYFVGGFSATYLRRGNVVLIPVRLGVGMRLGANIGYMKFSEKSRWLPF